MTDPKTSTPKTFHVISIPLSDEPL